MAIWNRDVISARELEDLVDLDEHDPRVEPSAGISRPGRVLLASLLASAGAIHFAMVPAHAGEWLPEGIAFAATGWLQVGLAVLIAARSSRVAVRISCMANVAFVAAWVVSRISGLPVGPEAGVRQAASFVDIVCVALEVLAVVVGYELLARPTLGAHLGRRTRGALAVVPFGVLVLATAALVSPSATNHAHGSEGADHEHASAAAAPGVESGDDKGLSEAMNGQGEGGGHLHDTSVVALDATTQARLDAQLAHTGPLIEKYPTVGDAEAAGYQRQGPFAPALGAHYSKGGAGSVSFGPTMEGPALDNPMLIYDGIDPDSKLAGFMYNIFSTDTQNPPEGFAGPNDHWHYHTNVCLAPRPGGGIDSPLGADASATQELCDKYGGRLIANTGYMVHVWTVPGYESEEGVFSNLNKKITCPDGTYYRVKMEEIGNRTNVCRDVPG